MNTFYKEVVKTNRDVRWWNYAARTLPFVALAILAFEYWFGFKDLLSKTLVVISVTFFSASVYWWWWALNRIYEVIKQLNKTEQKLEEVKEEIIKTRETIKDL